VVIARAALRLRSAVAPDAPSRAGIFEPMPRLASGQPIRSERLGLGDAEFAPWVLGVGCWGR